MKEQAVPAVRVATQDDKKEFDKLWRLCFGDSEDFCSWFFENRFAPDYSVVLEAEGEIRSCMQAFPYTLLIRGKEVSGAMLCGVSTHPDHRGKGYMGRIFSFEMNYLRQKGCIAVPHTPAVLPSYFSFGHFPVANAAYLECNVIPLLTLSENICMISKNNWSRLFPLYERFAQKYSGIIQRTEADFLRKAADYSADGGKCIAYTENNQIKGYAFYYQTEEQMLCVEAVAEDGYWENLINGLFALGVGLKFSAKLPPDVQLSCSFASFTIKQKGVMGLCNASELLKTLDLNIPYSFCLKDPVVPENNGCFTFRGESCKDTPVFEISAGHLLQALVGYHTLDELRNEILIFDETKFLEVNDALPKQNCYIIDEY